MKTITPIFFALVTALMLTGCGGLKEVRITEGSQPVGEQPAEPTVTSKTTIVHVDLSARIVTIRNARRFEPGSFLVAKDAVTGKQTGILKAIPQRVIGLRTADILEGEPQINDTVQIAPASETERLSKIYRDPEEQ